MKEKQFTHTCLCFGSRTEWGNFMKKQRRTRTSLCRMAVRRRNIKGHSNGKIRISRYTIESKHLPRAFCGFRIAHLSDLHGTLYGINHQLLMEKVSQVKPDCIVMTGDMADQTPGSVPRLVQLCGRLKKRWPVYFAAGNHEQCLKRTMRAKLYHSLKEQEITVLKNRYCKIWRQGEAIRMYGLVTPMMYYNDPLGKYRRGAHFSAKDTKRMLGEADPSVYSILLAHNPLYYPSYRDWGADLTLSGHIHGGIIRIPGAGGLLSPDVSLFPKYDGGHFEEQGKHLIVSRGLGNHFLVRVFNPPELVVVTLERG